MRKIFALLFACITCSFLMASTNIGDLYYNLTSSTLTAEVTYQSQWSSSNYQGLTDVVIPATVTYGSKIYKVTSIGNNAFYRCSCLTSITIPSSVTSIGNSAFSNCSGLTSITIPNSVTSIGDNAFSNCYSLTSVAIPDGVTSIGAYAFYYCSSLASITIPNGVTSIGAYAFYYCSSLASITIPDGVTSIGEYAFGNVANIIYNGDATGSWGERYRNGYTEGVLTYSDNTKTQLVSCPRGAKGEIVIPNSVTSITNDAFNDCIGLTNVTIPNSVTSITGNGAFYNIANIIYNGEATGSPWGARSVNGYVDGNLVYSTASKTELLSCFTSAEGEIVIPNSVVSIGNNAFQNCSLLTSIILPNSVTSIGYNVINGCSSINTPIYNAQYFVYMPRNYKGEYSIPTGIKTIYNSAFNGCDSITSITIPNSVTSIGDNAFSYCYSLTSVTLPSSLQTIPWNCFSSCSSLQSIKIPTGVNRIKGYAFSSCYNLEKITIPRTLTSIEDEAFDSDENLKTIINKSGLPLTAGMATFGKIALNAQYILTEDSENNDICENGFCFEINGNDTVLVRVESYSSDITLPTTIWGAPRKYAVAPNIFMNFSYDSGSSYSISISENNSIKSLTIPNNVTSVGSLVGASALEEIIFEEGSPITSLPQIGHQDIELTYSDGINIWSTSQTYSLGNLRRIVLPDNLVSLEDYAFSECSQLSEITIPNSVKSIGSYAFSNCYQLSEITIPNSVKSIGSYAFYNCSSLKSFAIPQGVTSIEEKAFLYCSNLSSIDVHPDNSQYSSEDGIMFNKDKTQLVAFPENKDVLRYTIPSSVTTIGRYAFNNCRILCVLSVPAQVTSIQTGNNVPFYYFDGDTPATIESSAFGSDVFLIVNDTTPYKAAWANYKSRIFPRALAVQNIEVEANNSLSSIHKKIGDKNLESIVDLTIKGSINSYDLMIMRNKMINLKILDLTEARVVANPYEYYTGYSSQDNILRNHSFKNLYSLKLPSSLQQADSVITECPNLKYLEINGGAVTGYMAPSYNSLNVVLNEGVTSISSTAFAGRSGLKSITLPASLGSIAANTFKDCRELTSVVMADGLTAVGDGAFINCTSLSSVIIANSISTIGNGAFTSCTNLSQVTLPNSLQRIGNEAFFNVPINELVIPASVRSIGTKAFAGTKSYSGYYYNNPNTYYYYSGNGISSNTIGSSNYAASGVRKLRFEEGSILDSIGEFAFYYCRMDTLIVPDSVKYIGKYAFCNCNNLKYISFSDKSHLTAIPDGAFQNCGAITSLHLPKSLESIGELAFSVHNYSTSDSLELVLPEKVTKISRGAFYSRGSNLKHVAFPNTLKSIERDAFRSCDGLTNVSFPTSLQTIGDYAFEGCKGLTEIRVPSTLLSVGDYAFSNCGNVTKVYTYTVEPVAINQNTFSCWHNADLYVPTTSYYTYYYNTQWSQFLSLKQFDEEYEYFYINNDYELGGDNGTIDGNPDADLNENSGLIVTGDEEQGMGTITIMGDGVNAGSILACEENLNADSLAIRIVTQKGKWNYFCFPFDLILDQFHFAHQYVIREYSGATRAQYGAGGWIDLIGDMIHRGLGYIFQGAQTDTLVITIKNPKISCEDFQQTVLAHASDNIVHSNWNFIGNPYPSWYDLDALFEWGFSSAVYIWNGVDYQVYMPGDDEYHFHPYEGFFTQNPQASDLVITWGSDGRETKSQADEKHGKNHAPRKAVREMRQASQQRKLINIELASDDYTDQTRIVFNDAAKLSYELGRDAVKMEGGNAPLHIWSIAENNRLSINERPYDNGQICLGYDVKEEGSYTLSASRMDTVVIIYDNELKQEVDLSLGDYHFFTAAGTNETRFSVIRVKKVENTATGLDEISNDQSSMTNKLIHDGQLYIKQDEQIFDVIGKKIK